MFIHVLYVQYIQYILLSRWFTMAASTDQLSAVFIAAKSQRKVSLNSSSITSENTHFPREFRLLYITALSNYLQMSKLNWQFVPFNTFFSFFFVLEHCLLRDTSTTTSTTYDNF